MTRLCLNMIVKNEAARIERCLVSVAPYIDAYTIVDTGSTDGTPDIIGRFFAEREIRGAVFGAPFEDFSQARNEALRKGAVYLNHGTPACDYFLLIDADMELRVEDQRAFDSLTGLSYDMVQKSGALSYHNRRLVSTRVEAKYLGVTHEYLDVPSAGTIEGAYFIDHADGENRKDKFSRDAILLTAALAKDPNNARYWFYLGQTYRDNGRFEEAAQAYKKRIDLGGWDEETWNAMMCYATCLKDMGNEDGFIANMLKAYAYRPQRAEVLYDLSKFFRERGNNPASVMLAKQGLSRPRPDDLLFVNDFVYQHGLKEEFSIAAYYDPLERAQGFAVCNELALSKSAPESTRELARSNLFYYLKPLSAFCRSWTTNLIMFDSGLNVLMNPSVEQCNGKIRCIVRGVNYDITESGHYMIRGTDGTANGDNPIATTNYMVALDVDLKVKEVWPIRATLPEPKFNLVLGFEDMRLFRRNGELFFNACVREQSETGVCEQWEGRLAPPENKQDGYLVVGATPISDGSTYEKNWMAIEGTSDYFYRLDVIMHGDHTSEKTETPYAIEQISGGSPAIKFAGGYLAVVHEARYLPGTMRRYYQHRFAYFDNKCIFRRLSLPFYFHDRQIEFAAGLAVHPNGTDLMISYGIRDKQAWVARVSMEEIRHFIWDHHEG